MKARRLLAAIAALAMFATGCSAIGADGGYEVTAQFERTFNLFPGSPVRILGIEVGDVRELNVSPGDEYVTATLRLNDGVQLPADVRAIIFTDSLLGERFVQLDPPYVDGPTFEAGGTIAIDETMVPAEFDEVLEALNRFAEGVETGDLPRLVDNLAEVLDGNGENIGETLDAAQDALAVLRDNDDELLALARELASLNSTLNTRNSEIAELITDFADLSGFLAGQRGPIDESLGALARLTDETGRLLEANRGLLEDDIEIVTRVGRTVNRNLDEVSLLLLGSAELFRHAERVLDRERNWLPLVNNTDDLTNEVLATVGRRLLGLCAREGIPTDMCEQLNDALDQLLPDQICLPPLVSCTESTEAGAAADARTPLEDAVADALDDVAPPDAAPDSDEGRLRELVDSVLGGLGRDQEGGQ